MKPKHRRLISIGISLAIGGIGIGLILNTLNNKIVFFYSPSEITQELRAADREIRVGGLVEKGSVQKSPDGQSYAFVIMDHEARIFIKYRGLLPDLFREGQGIIAHGTFKDASIFSANEILAKHDENYAPPSTILPHNGASIRLGRGERLKVEGL